jgi:hypothetical protein
MGVRLYSALPENIDVLDASDRIRRILDQLNWGKNRFELFVLPDRDFKRLFHFRYLRFDVFCRLKLDAGLEVIQGDALYRPVDITIEEVRRDVLRLEQRCVDACGQPLLVYP